MAPRVAVYARISDALEDDGEVTERGVRRQAAACRDLCAIRGWEVAGEYVDNNVSAYKDVNRPEYLRMLDDVRAGDVDGIVVWDLDRLARRVVDLEKVIDLYDQRRGLLFATAQGDINLGSADGLTMARVMVAFANKASRDTARRVAAAHMEKRLSGKSHQGAHVGWGFRKAGDRIEPDPKLAPIIQRSAERLAAQDVTLTQLAHEWNDAGLRTATGKAWSVTGVRAILVNPRYAGLVVHRGEPVVNPRTGGVVWADHDAIFSLEVWQTIRRSRHAYADGGGRKPVTLLGAIIRCAECGTPMLGRRRGTSPAYVCQPHKGGCGRVTVSLRGADGLVVPLLLRALQDEVQGEEVVVRDDGLDAQIDELERERDSILAQYRQHRNLGDVLLPEASAITDRIGALRAERTSMQKARELPRTMEITRETWDGLNILEQRAHLLRHIEAVYATKAEKRGPKFNPDRITVVWRSTPSTA